MAAGEAAPNPFDCEEGGTVFLDEPGRGECPVCWAVKGGEGGAGVMEGGEGRGTGNGNGNGAGGERGRVD